MTETRASYTTPNLIFPTLDLDPENYARLRMRLDLYDDLILATKFGEAAQAEAVFAVDPTDLAQALNGLTAHSGLLPPGCLCWGRKDGLERLAIYVEPQVWPVAVHGHKKTWHIPLPGVVFVGQGTDYKIFAVQDQPPGAETILYRFPSPNVDVGGLICGGNAPFPAASSATIWEALHMFFESGFNRHLANKKSAAHPENVLEMWQTLQDKGATVYPLGDLIEAGHTLQGVIG